MNPLLCACVLLEAKVVDALGGENHVRARLEDFLNPLLGDVHFALPDPFHFLGVLDHHL